MSLLVELLFLFSAYFLIQRCWVFLMDAVFNLLKMCSGLEEFRIKSVWKKINIWFELPNPSANKKGDISNASIHTRLCKRMLLML